MWISSTQQLIPCNKHKDWTLLVQLAWWSLQKMRNSWKAATLIDSVGKIIEEKPCCARLPDALMLVACSKDQESLTWTCVAV
jgi:hypothetical protein